MKKFWKTILAIGGAIVGIFALFAASKQSQSKKEFKKKVKENNDKIDEVKKQSAIVEKQKSETKAKIKETDKKVTESKSKIKSTKMLNLQFLTLKKNIEKNEKSNSNNIIIYNI